MSAATEKNATTNPKIKPKVTQNEHPVSDSVRETLHKSVDALAEKAAYAETSMRNGAARGSESIVEGKERATKAWKESAIKRYATENPVATAGIAFALGAMAASLIRRK
ncbi:DUF883 domain-containing protein [Glaciecola sp. 1036]|uniref:DUF883 domain-containing protein n=1 Tax=Alteromonadaceae TaxID=72275 RepID=UPI003D027A90